MNAQAVAVAAAVSRAAPASGSNGTGTEPAREPVTRDVIADWAGEPVTTKANRTPSIIFRVSGGR
ncbi:hypothetical protein [Streptomyces geranii]|uniref:hypothetical protein n=1 Tax=Streptomyces geranii TaxID=2058923 RepID=UPI0018E52FAA